jgi:hypothetical protein
VIRQRSSTCKLPRDSCREGAVRKRQQCVLRGLKEIDELPGYGGGDTLNDCFDSFHSAPPLKLSLIAVLRKHLGSHEPSAYECSAWESFPQRGVRGQILSFDVSEVMERVDVTRETGYEPGFSHESSVTRPRPAVSPLRMSKDKI